MIDVGAKKKPSGVVSTLALFGSLSTLICCALPAVFVLLGAGATLGSLVSAFPQLIWLSEHKVGLFIFAGIMLTFSGVMRWRSRNDPCPVDSDQAKACGRLRRISLYVFVFSLCMYVIGFFFAFIAARVL
jgi:hypothetical protein